MKRTTAFIISVLLCFAFSVISFADDIYIVDDGEEPFVPDVQVTTTAPAITETTTSSGGSSIIGDTGALEGYFNDLKDKLGSSVDSLFEGLDDFDFNLGTENTTASGGQTPPSIDSGEKPTQSTHAQQMIQDAATNTTKPFEEKTTVIQGQGNEVHTIVIVENADDDSALSGSTLTLIVFIAAIVIIILAGAIVLVIMTKRTEYNSSVMDKSTIPTVEKPKAMTDLLNDNIVDDGNDYGNIAYWND